MAAMEADSDIEAYLRRAILDKKGLVSARSLSRLY
jgi:hypothetical protein